MWPSRAQPPRCGLTPLRRTVDTRGSTPIRVVEGSGAALVVRMGRLRLRRTSLPYTVPDSSQPSDLGDGAFAARSHSGTHTHRDCRDSSGSNRAIRSGLGWDRSRLGGCFRAHRHLPCRHVGACSPCGGVGLSAQYHVLSGRRIVATKSGFSAREVALDYLRAMGCQRDEIIYYGVDGVSWRGAIYRARLVEAEPDVWVA